MPQGTQASSRLTVFRSSSFRIVALFTGCFFLSGMTVAGLSNYHGIQILNQQIRQSVANERDEAISNAHGADLSHLRPVIEGFVQNEPGFYYLLQDARQTVIVGNMLHLRPVTGWRKLSWTHRSLPPTHHPVIGYGLKLDDGGYLFVGMDGRPLDALWHDLWLTLTWNALLFILIGLAGGLVLSRLVLGRIEAINRTTRHIMRGDMSQRILRSGANDEFDHLASSLNAMLDRNEVLIAGIRQVTDDIAHDMRRPLAHLGQHLDEIAQTPLTFQQAETVARARDNLDTALEIFSSLLKLAQIEADDRVPESRLLSVHALLTTITDLYRPIAEDRGQTLVLHPPERNMTLEGNQVLMTQMLANLVENALNHTPAGTTVSLSAETRDAAITLVVADDGPGIPAHERERVFGKMVRLDASRSVPGTGLGLSMVRAIVRLHGGQIRLTDNHPGLRCEIGLPAAPGATS
ncbi:MAG: HAMP domain-containing sensor histidine kinase [Gluconacetobacter liquefaciens]